MPVYRTSGDTKYILFCPVCRNTLFKPVFKPVLTFDNVLFMYICSMCGGVHYSAKKLISCTEEELKKEMSFRGVE